MRGANSKNLILVADDDLFVRKVIHSALNTLTEIVETVDGAQVLELYRQHTPDIVLLDIHLPHKTGLELIHPILRHDPDAHIIILSADSSAQNVVQAQTMGCKSFLTKPFDKQRLLQLFHLCPTIRFADS